MGKRRNRSWLFFLQFSFLALSLVREVKDSGLDLAVWMDEILTRCCGVSRLAEEGPVMHVVCVSNMNGPSNEHLVSALLLSSNLDGVGSGQVETSRRTELCIERLLLVCGEGGMCPNPYL